MYVGLVIAAILVAGGFILHRSGPRWDFRLRSGRRTSQPGGRERIDAAGGHPDYLAPTPTPTPAGEVVRSDDGQVMLTIPNGAVPPGTSVSVAARGQADAPPELAGVTSAPPSTTSCPPDCSSPCRPRSSGPWT